MTASSIPSNTECNLALLGFGNVGKAFASLLLEKAQFLQTHQIHLPVVGIATKNHGLAIDSRGIPLGDALKAVQDGKSLSQLSSHPVPDLKTFLDTCGAGAILETTPVNYQTGQPALGYLETALEQGMHAITANKGPVVHGFRKLKELAESRQRAFLFESTVMDGAPVFSIARCGLPGAKIRGFQGILNSTTNMILSRMEEGESMAEAVAYAQSIGIAETDPSGDLDGWDAAVKVAALVTVLMDHPLTPEQVQRTGIRKITQEQVKQAAAQGKRWKLVCTARQDANLETGIAASVQPQLIEPSSPLYQIKGTSAILQIDSDVLGRLSLIEENPSPKTTAYGLLADLLNALKPS